jgi:hypothetical protein
MGQTSLPIPRLALPSPARRALDNMGPGRARRVKVFRDNPGLDKVGQGMFRQEARVVLHRALLDKLGLHKQVQAKAGLGKVVLGKLDLDKPSQDKVAQDKVVPDKLDLDKADLNRAALRKACLAKAHQGHLHHEEA